jgi:hypothetical protein
MPLFKIFLSDLSSFLLHAPTKEQAHKKASDKSLRNQKTAKLKVIKVMEVKQ